MFGTRMDPVPYITAAYGIGIILMVIYAAWQLRLRKRLRSLETALLHGDAKL